MRAAFQTAIVAVLLVACAPSPPPQPAAPAGGSPVAPQVAAAPKVLNLAINEDPPSVWEVATGGGGGGGGRALLPAVNQFLVVTGADGTPHPRLLAELPSVEAGTWQLLPDGAMRVTWKLREGVTWHDGTPFTSADIAFSVELNRDPEVPNSNRSVVSLISDVETPDSSTVVVTWSRIYPFADRLSDRELVPVARHLLEGTYRDSKEAVLLQPYWNLEYVGLGPYRIGPWERGSSLELRAYDGYFLGRPKIDTIRVHFVPDDNTLVANLLARAIDTALPPGGADFEPLSLVQRDWEASGYGTTLQHSDFWTFIDPQKARNPQPADLADSRVRRALLVALDRKQIVELLFGEAGTVGESWLKPGAPHYRLLEDAIPRHPHDPRRAEQLFGEAGWQRGPDGQLQKAGQRFDIKIRHSSGEQVPSIMADQLKNVGVRAEFEVVSPQAQRDRSVRATYTGLDITANPMMGYAVQRRFHSNSNPTAEKSWIGVNRGGYLNPEWDALGDRFLTTLEESGRLSVERELLGLFNADLPALPLSYSLQLTPVGGGLTGIQPITGVPHQGTVLYAWNVHEWDLSGKTQ